MRTLRCGDSKISSLCFSASSASGCRFRGPGPSKHDSGRKTCPREAVETSGGPRCEKNATSGDAPYYWSKISLALARIASPARAARAESEIAFPVGATPIDFGLDPQPPDPDVVTFPQHLPWDIFCILGRFLTVPVPRSGPPRPKTAKNFPPSLSRRWRSGSPLNLRLTVQLANLQTHCASASG